jgi:hypothetical protein
LSLPGCTGEAKDVDAVVDGDDDDILCVSEVFAIVERTVGVSNSESCTIRLASKYKEDLLITYGHHRKRPIRACLPLLS